MAITSTGYQGTVGDVQWARMVARVGASIYSVDEPNSFKLAATTGTRAATVSSGGASGFGIYDFSNATETITFDSVPTGSRWDLVVLRRTWSTKTTSIAIVQGGSAKAIPPRTTNPGVVDEQPLYLVNVIPGSALGAIVDLRCFVGSGGLVASDDLARSYLSRPGTQIRIGNLLWSRALDATGAQTWAYHDVTPDTGWVAVTRNSGWKWGSTYHARRIGGVVFLRITATRTQGWPAGGNLATLPAAFRPDDSWEVLSSHNAGRTEFVINTDGTVDATQASAGATSVTLRTSFPARKAV